MRKLRKITESKQWQLWCAVIWSAMAAVWTRNFLQMRSLIERGIFSEYLGSQHLLADGLLDDADFTAAMMIHVLTGLDIPTGTVIVSAPGSSAPAAGMFEMLLDMDCDDELINEYFK